MMVLKNKNLSMFKYLAAIIMLFITCFYFTITASATNNYSYWVYVGTSSDGKTVTVQSIGAVLNWKGSSYIVCDGLSSGSIYAYSNDDNSYYQMEKCENPTGTNDGLDWFTPTNGLDFTPAPVIQGTLGGVYTVYYIDNDVHLQTGSITIDECEECGNIYQVTVASSNVGDGYYPMIIENDAGEIIGYIPRADAAGIFECPSGNNGGSSSSGNNGGSGSGTSSGSNGSASNKNDDHTTIFGIVGIAVLASLGGVYYKRRKNSNTTNGTPLKPSPKPTPVQEYDPTPVPAPDLIQPPVPAPTPILAPAPIPVPQQRNGQSKGWFVQMDGGVMNGFIYPVHTGILIGRNPECNVRYPADTKGVSRNHCKIFVSDNNLFVMDLGSTSGTFLRGVGQLNPNVPQSIRQGDVIYLGEKKNGVIIRYNQ